MNYINDPHPRVRYACCNAIGQMSTDFAPVFEKKFHARVIPGYTFLQPIKGVPLFFVIYNHKTFLSSQDSCT